MERVFKMQSKYNQSKNIVNHIYNTQNSNLKNYNICECKMFKFVLEKMDDENCNDTKLCDVTTRLCLQRKINKCSYTKH